MSEAHPWQDQDTNEYVVDYCIIGAGISGLYSGVRLSQVPRDQEPPRICILEATNRIGGRVATVKIPSSSLHAELGAMRYIPKQPLLTSLVEHFELQPYNYNFPTDFYFVRGRRLQLNEQNRLVSLPLAPQDQSSGPLYHSLYLDELDKDPAQLVLHGIAKALSTVRAVEINTRDTSNRFASIADLNRRLADCYDRVVKDRFLAFTPTEWRTIKLLGKYPNTNGLFLYQLGFWDVLQSQLSSEAYSFVDEGLGYQTIIGSWNAADAIPWFLTDFAGVPYKSIHGGMGQIPLHLHETFLLSMARRRDLTQFKESQVIFSRTKARKIFWEESPEQGDPHIIVDADISIPEKPKLPIRIRCSNCLVCVSKGAIERIKLRVGGRGGVDESREFDLKKQSVLLTDPMPAHSELGELKRQRRRLSGTIVNAYAEDDGRYDLYWALDCTEAQPLLKMFFAYSFAWWDKIWTRSHKEAPPSRGFSVFTNLPLRQLYYHFPAVDSNSKPDSSSSTPRAPQATHAREGEGMIMAYCDAKHASYWEALAPQGQAKFGADRAHSEAERTSLEEFGVSRHLKERADEQIWRVHRGLLKKGDVPEEHTELSDFAPRNEHGEKERIASSESVLFMNWMRMPYYGGWHAWRIGVVSDDLKEIWERPWPAIPIFFAGEAFSSDQGWGEGALRSAERILMHQLKLPPPKWEKGIGAHRTEVDLEKKVKDLGFNDIEDYIRW